MSAIMYASREGKSQIVNRLVELKPNLDKQDNRGYTVRLQKHGEIFIIFIAQNNSLRMLSKPNLTTETNVGPMPKDCGTTLKHHYDKFYKHLEFAGNCIDNSHLKVNKKIVNPLLTLLGPYIDDFKTILNQIICR